SLSFVFILLRTNPHLHSFPTRRSSDLVNTLFQHTWLIGNNKVNEFRFQFARRGLRYDFSKSPGGSNVAVNIAGYGFFGREPFSLDRKSTRLNSSHDQISYAVFCLKKKN